MMDTLSVVLSVLAIVLMIFGIDLRKIQETFSTGRDSLNRQAKLFVENDVVRSIWLVESSRSTMFSFMSYFLFVCVATISYLFEFGLAGVVRDTHVSQIAFYFAIVLGGLSFIYLTQSIIARMVIDRARRLVKKDLFPDRMN